MPGHDSLYQQALRRFVQNKAAVLGALFLIGMILVALLAPRIAPYDPLERHSEFRRSPPSRQFLMGTDPLGRDILSRVIFGSRISLQVGLISVGIALLAGVPLGLLAGYYGGLWDGLIMRLMDVILAFPGVLFAIWLISMLGPSLRNVMIAVGLFGVPSYARVVRGSTLSAKENEYVLAARCVGVRTGRLILLHLLPNVIAPVIVLSTLSIAGAILAGAALSFLGLGARPPTPEWGAMLSDGRAYLRSDWWISIFPGLAITLTVLAANMLGDGLRDALDPRMN